MTLAPGRVLGPRLQLILDDEVVVIEDLGSICAVPGCIRQPEPGSHHIEPRSRTGGPKMFVVIDGVIVVNRCRLCTVHHNAVTGEVGGHKARIVWHSDPVGHWCWLERILDSRAVLSGAQHGWAVRGPLRIPPVKEVCNGVCAL